MKLINFKLKSTDYKLSGDIYSGVYKCETFLNLHSKARYDSQWRANRGSCELTVFNDSGDLCKQTEWTNVYTKKPTEGERALGAFGSKHTVSRDPLISCSNTPAATLTNDAAAFVSSHRLVVVALGPSVLHLPILKKIKILSYFLCKIHLY